MNSIVGNNQNNQPVNPTSLMNNPQMISQLQAFKNSFNGDPKQAVMALVNQGKITNGQLQQAMQLASQLQHLIK